MAAFAWRDYMMLPVYFGVAAAFLAIVGIVLAIDQITDHSTAQEWTSRITLAIQGLVLSIIILTILANFL